MKRTLCLAFALLSAVSATATAHAQQFGRGRQGRWQPVRFPDGSGSINLAPGWVMDGAARGTLVAHGPRGEYATLGMPVLVQERGRPGARGPLVLPYTPNPVAAFVRLSQEIARRQGDPGLAAHVLRAQRVPAFPGANAATVVYEYRRHGQPYRGFAHLITMKPGPGAWIFQSSSVCAPVSIFPASAQTMMAMWQSWRRGGQPNGGGQVARPYAAGRPSAGSPYRAASPYVAFGGSTPDGADAGPAAETGISDQVREQIYAGNDKFDREVIRGTQMTTDPESGEQVERPLTENHWKSSGGNYLDTDSNVDPNTTSSETWHQTEGE